MKSELSGSFILGIGGVNGHPRYYFYAEKDGGLILTSADAEWVILKEENSTPRYIDYRQFAEHDVLIIPDGTIKKEFSVSGGDA